MGPRCQEHARPAAGWEGRLSKQDSRPVESITQLISRKTASGKRNFPSHSKKSKKIRGHFRELLMETDGNVCREVERPRLGERPPHGEAPQRPTRTVCTKDPAEILALTNPTSTHALHFPSFLILPSHLFYSPSFLEWRSRKKITKMEEDWVATTMSTKRQSRAIRDDSEVVATQIQMPLSLLWYLSCFSGSYQHDVKFSVIERPKTTSFMNLYWEVLQILLEIVWKLRNTSNNFSLRISNIRFSLEKTANLVYILLKLFKNVQFASKRYTGITHTVAAFINQVLDSSAIWHNWVQLSNGGDEQVLDNTNTRTLGRSGACWKSTFPNSSIRWCSKSANREGSAALQQLQKEQKYAERARLQTMVAKVGAFLGDNLTYDFPFLNV